jgi:diguanylate cyclase
VARSEALAELLATLSHELRTPLNAICGWTTLLRSGRLDPPTIERALETIERNARAQQQLIEELQDVSRLVSGQAPLQITLVEPRALVESVLATLAGAAEARHIALAAEFAGTGPVRADPERLQQLLNHLVSDAIQISPEGGRVGLRLERDQAFLQITVRDSRPGVPANRHAGLGVALARFLVELHDGTMVAAAGPAEGTSVTVRIPVGDVHPGKGAA